MTVTKASVKVYCNEQGCNYHEEWFHISVTEIWGEEANFEDELKKAGWLIVDKNKHICHHCQEEADE